ncbi:MAG: hypothetical protein A3B99_04230 [Candidatus Yanofskybacteria bacterium RIFCSPHIGHO2_02_FULL_44_12b]|uniref:WavE lipopolysaccharide synthesis n=2 Tax=Candidatus Yanofskyibacteriota TaxID=1752733 RepID=A0A1F8GMX4_9BACT|nr:MAG: hypothetical protein UW79_C0019G0030 [Candidatus Yanofskybacteria bacterium GW2011_GWA2_44_9]OGN04613.1 MAG: hypothetical protein A2659_00610 [Candidatus Yanofskybacteria bacterium RIFCSPHIGHO2_01_FULL_44_24]OGN15721.1 MAG: hypothetical protein A3B99_04230 [Candidatus Yanofskybacteria bacterium RIFCSPHIGHO2_02_FULL_44_12b]OGN26777.1 MAG: hypothetical protein A2925_04315 [Candidatus Yanofskybacteria bacterium RIFCSPLOWO2_01_FULL_44_22]
MKFLLPLRVLRKKEKIFLFFLNWVEKTKGKFMTLHARPMYASGIESNSKIIGSYPKTAIVMQGPILKANDFTLETVRIYKKLHPKVLIIVSTWNDEDPAYLDKIRQENAEIVLSEKPRVTAPARFFNINFQIASTIAGIKRAEALGTEYVLKTRNDQRMYSPGLFEYLHNLLEYFPPENSQRIFMKKRLAALGARSGGSKLYYLSDELLFGNIEDMVRYWQINLVKKDTENFSSVEGYLFSTFLKNIGRDILWTIEDSHEAYAKYCVIIDPLYADLYFHKYERHMEYRTPRYKHIRHQPLFFLDWLKIYNNYKNRQTPVA